MVEFLAVAIKHHGDICSDRSIDGATGQEIRGGGIGECIKYERGLVSVVVVVIKEGDDVRADLPEILDFNDADELSVLGKQAAGGAQG